MSGEYLSPQDFEAAIDTHINWAKTWEGALPADTFFGLWAEILHEKQTLTLTATVVEGQLRLVAPPESPLVVKDNRIRLNGLELVIHLQ